MFEKILAIAMALTPPWYPKGENPETPEQYEARVRVIAQAVTLEAKQGASWPWSQESLAIIALITAYYESGFKLEVHNGTKLGDTGQSRCLGQVKSFPPFITRPEWLASTGTDLMSTRTCFRISMRVLRSHAWRCAGVDKLSKFAIAKTLAGYGTGSSCYYSNHAMSRATLMMKTIKRYKED